MNSELEQNSSKCFIISAPSGTGKTTLNYKLKRDIPILKYSVSDTTRPQRPNEINGADYNFITRDNFFQRVDRGDYLEWANVHGNYYGTSKETVVNDLNIGYSIIFDLDVNGYQQIREKFPKQKLCSIFILPPSLDILRERISSRKAGMSDEALEVRMQNAEKEMRSVWEYDYNVFNDDLKLSYPKFRGIVETEMGFNLFEKMFYRIRAKVKHRK